MKPPDPEQTVPHVPVDDGALVARIRAGDADALGALFRRYAQPLGRFIHRMLGTRDLAQEVVQDVFIKLWDMRIILQIQGTVRSYLFQAARNGALNMQRREASQMRRVDGMPPESTASTNAAVGRLEADDLRILVLRTLDALPPRCREIFLLNWESGLSYAEISALLGISLPTIHNQMSRATRHLVEHLPRNL